MYIIHDPHLSKAKAGLDGGENVYNSVHRLKCNDLYTKKSKSKKRCTVICQDFHSTHLLEKENLGGLK